jgi:hypothetical protein
MGNKLVSKEVSAFYRGHMLQQAGYQEVLYWSSQEHYLRYMPLETSQYEFCTEDKLFHILQKKIPII